MRRVAHLFLGYLCLVFMVLFSCANAPCQSSPSVAILNRPIATGVSLPWRERQQLVPTEVTDEREGDSLFRSLYPDASALTGFTAPMSPADIHDPVMQVSSGPAVPITIGLSLEGIKQGQGFSNITVPDTNVAVGDIEVVEYANNAYYAWNKFSGAYIEGPVMDGNLFAGQQGLPHCADGGHDGIVQWDKLNHRWIITYPVARIQYPTKIICIAVSQSPSLTGLYTLYEYDMSNTSFGFDYPKWGVWSNGYYQTLNGQPNFPSAVCGYDSAKMVAKDPTAKQICVALQFDTNNPTRNDIYLMPADIDSDSTVSPPPSGEDEFFIGSVGQGPSCSNGTCSDLYLYSMHIVSWTAGTATVQGIGTTRPIPVPSFTLLCPSGGFLSNCIPQPGGSNSPALEGLGQYTMYRLAYWNEGTGGMQHWYLNHVVAAGSGAGVRWYDFKAPEIPAISLGVNQSGTFIPSGGSGWMGSIARDKFGDIALGYSESGTGTFPSIYATGRLFSDPLGTMEGEVQLKGGSGIDPNSTQNWGDYSGLALDGQDSCTFWYANEYYVNTDANWHTRVIQFKFPSCQ
jgi:hypothetical protein